MSSNNHAKDGSDSGWNMFEDTRHPIYVQRPHSSHPHPPPVFGSATSIPLHPRACSSEAVLYPLHYRGGTSMLPKEEPAPSTSMFNMALSSLQSTPELTVHLGEHKSTMTARAIKDHTELLEVIERVRPLTRDESFGRMQEMLQTAVQQPPDDILGHDFLLQLIMQHLHTDGLRASRKILEEESHIKYMDYQLSTSRLLTLIQLAVKDPEQVWVQPKFLTEGPSTASDDVNIWDEVSDCNVVYGAQNDFYEAPQTYTKKPKPLIAASLNQLVIALTTPTTTSATTTEALLNDDLEYFKTFMLTYQSFTTPEKLLQKLIERYHVPRRDQTAEEWRLVSGHVQERVGNVLLAWVRDQWTDFSKFLVKSLKSFIDNDLRLDGNLTLAKSLSTYLNNKLHLATDSADDPEGLTANIQYFTKDISRPPSSHIPRSIYSAAMSVLDVDEEEIARQLTLVDFALFSSIKVTEFLHQAWNKPKLKQRAPNIIRACQHSNDISTWVSNSILKIEPVKDRARTMAKFIRVAEHLIRTLNNFNSGMSVLAGLQAPAVNRLKRTRAEIPNHVLRSHNELQAMLSPNASYKEYRTILSRAAPPCIPYLGLILTDLTSIEENNADYIHGSLIHFSKYRLIYNVIVQARIYQHTPYKLTPVYQIACHLCNPLHESGSDKMSEDEQHELHHQLSMTIEPRNNDDDLYDHHHHHHHQHHHHHSRTDDDGDGADAL